MQILKFMVFERKKSGIMKRLLIKNNKKEVRAKRRPRVTSRSRIRNKNSNIKLKLLDTRIKFWESGKISGTK